MTSRGSPRATPRWLQAAARCALVLAGVGGAGCRQAGQVIETGLTGVELTVQYEGLLLDQLAVSGSVGGQAAFVAATLPDPARPLALDQETVVILLPEARQGAEVRVRVDGLVGGGLAGSGQAYVVLQARALVGLSITLGPGARCGDGLVQGHAEECDDGNDTSGDGCSSSCFVETGYTCTRPTMGPSQCVHDGSCDGACPGCCSGATCTAPATLRACGVHGSTCMDCSVVGDRCSTDGQCTCGPGPECGPGLHCVSGSCVCDQTSCPAGCCDGDLCAPRAFQACGAGGAACAPCDPATTDTCASTGACQCGAGPPCDSGQWCAGGTCVCDARSCSGCCAGSLCLSGSADAACGAAGVVCEPCATPATCSDGACSNCDSASCAGGCCTGSTCHESSMSFCGVDAVPCAFCDALRADTCAASGGCKCGTEAPCGAGQRCGSGSCVCDATSCPNGCCVGDGCYSPSLQQCGTAGGACVGCAPYLADNCAATGRCQCGAAAACSTGQRCTGGMCRCDPASCSGCCAAGTCVAGTLDTECGRSGAVCKDCTHNGTTCAGSHCR